MNFLQGMIENYLAGQTDEQLLALVNQHVLARITLEQKRKLKILVDQNLAGHEQAASRPNIWAAL